MGAVNTGSAGACDHADTPRRQLNVIKYIVKLNQMICYNCTDIRVEFSTLDFRMLVFFNCLHWPAISTDAFSGGVHMNGSSPSLELSDSFINDTELLIKKSNCKKNCVSRWGNSGFQ